MQDPAWEGPRWLYAFLLGLCAVLLYSQHVLSSKSKSSEKFFAHSPPAFVDFQRRFLIVFFLFSLTEGLQSVYGEALYEHYGYARQDIGFLVLVAHATSLFLGTFLGAAADSIGRKRACILCGLLQLVGCLARHSRSFSVLCLANICHGLAVSLFPAAFEAWLTAEHERVLVSQVLVGIHMLTLLGFRQEWLSRIFWVMAFGMGVAAIGTGVFANLMVDRFGFGLVSPPSVAAAVAGFCIFLILNSWGENVGTPQAGLYKAIFNACQALTDKKVFLLGLAQSSSDFSLSVFWYLWTPTLVADGREIHSGVIYSYLMASLMLGSAIAALLLCGPFNTRPESFLPMTFGVASLALFIPAYDHQEVGVLVTAFCVYHVCIGITWTSLARLRSIYIQNDRRAGVLSLYRIPVNIGVLFILFKGGILRQLENSTIFYICIFGLLSGSAALQVLNRWQQMTPKPSKPSEEESRSELHRRY